MKSLGLGWSLGRKRTPQSVGLSVRNILTNIWKGIKWIRELLRLIIVMENPLTPVKNVREVWNKSLNQKVKEVQVQVKDEPPAWIPLETLLALQNAKNESN